MKHPRGVILVELMLALGILTIMGGLITMTFYAGQRSGRTALKRTQAVQLAQEEIEAAKSVAEENYLTLYNLSKGSGNPYHPAIPVDKWTLATDTELVVLDGDTFTRKIVIDNVSRDSSGNIQSTYATSYDDPSTQKMTATVSVTGQDDVVLTNYYTRWRNAVPAQTSWSGGATEQGIVTSFSAGTYDTDDGKIDYSSGTIKLIAQ
ncbi:MAG: hypothetical protein Q7S16_01000 [bacterium]|nr:hypothetical protein [bacterium]